MDTSRDYRILVAEKSIGVLEDIVRLHKLGLPLNWGIVGNLVREAKTLLLKLKYSFLPWPDIVRSPELSRLKEVSKELARQMLQKDLLQRFKPDPLVVAKTKYVLRILYGLQHRLALGEENKPWYAVDIEGVEITSIHKHPNADKLYITKAEGLFLYTIITNIQDIKKGEVRAAAILPPTNIRGELSEAMYCSKPLPRGYKAKRPPENLIYTKEIASIIYNIVSRK